MSDDDINTIGDVLWKHAGNMARSFERDYDVPKPQRGANLDERVAAWERERAAAIVEVRERCLEDGYRRFYRLVREMAPTTEEG